MKLNRPHPSMFLKCLGLVLLAQGAQAATWYVATNGSDAAVGTNWATAKKTIQAAVNVTSVGDTVIVSNGVYNSGQTTAWLQGGVATRVVITNSITVRSVNGPQSTIIVGRGPLGTNAIRGVVVAGSATLSGFTITNGHSRLNNGTEGNDAASAGGIWCEAGGTVSNCVVTGCAAALYGGGVYCIDGGVLKNTALIGNRVTAYGGGVYCRAATVDTCVVRFNTSSNQYGGGVWSDFDSDIRNCILSENFAPGGGGGIFLRGGVVRDSLIFSNKSNYGGGVYFLGGGGTAINLRVVNNTATYAGGGVCCNQGGGVQGCLITNNSARHYGGGIYLDQGGDVRTCLIAGNVVTQGSGGGVYLKQAYGALLRNSTVAGNRAQNDGGGVYVEDGGAIHNTIIFHNTAVGTARNGTNNTANGAQRGAARPPCSPELETLRTIPRLLTHRVAIVSGGNRPALMRGPIRRGWPVPAIWMATLAS